MADTDIARRFFSASDDREEDGGKVSASKRWNEAVQALAAAAMDLPDTRNRNIALTHLEDVQMRGNRALFE